MIAPHPEPAPTAVAPRGAATPSQERDAALDICKGLLVVLMVVYHSVNYFGTNKDVLRYVHFLPTSFIFIAGYVITAIQQRKLESGDLAVRLRSAVRGIKLIGIFLLLNLAAHSLFTANYNQRQFGVEFFGRRLPTILLTGGQRSAVFEVLLPIGYLLILCSALLLPQARVRRPLMGVLSVAVWIGCAIFSLRADLPYNLELLSMGLLGMAAGLAGLAPLRRLGAHLAWLLAATTAYNVACAFRYPGYAMNTCGVILTLLTLVALGRRLAQLPRTGPALAMLGRYSLLGYIMHIAFLQVIFRVSRFLVITDLMLLPAFLIALASTIALVRAVEALRARSAAVDSSYRVVFA